MDDLGAPVSHLAVADGAPVYDPSGRRVGVVDRVMVDGPTGVFEGIVVHALPLPGRHLYATHDQIAGLRERGVLLAVEAGELHELSEHAARGRARRQAPESPLERSLRKAWDWLAGVR
jgi:hypothetical protein